MEGSDGPTAINIKPNSLKAAQEEMGRLDVLVCGQCHSVFHFVDEFQEHRSKDGACSKISNFRENSNIEQKAQVWAFLLWKDTQIQQESPDKDNNGNSWKLYQKWCKMDSHIRDCWITAGKTIQTFTKISNTKMQDVPQGSITDGGKTVFVRKIIRNGQPESPDKKELKTDAKIKLESMENKGKVKLRPLKIKSKTNESGENNAESSDEEYVVEKILAKRFNPKKKVYEYLLKWEGYVHEHNTWEEVAAVSMTCKQLMDEFEKNLAKQKELKAQQVAKSMIRANQMNLGQKVGKDSVKAGPSSSSGRPMRSSKSKAMDQVKQWCGSMNDEENEMLGKRKITFSDSESDDDGVGGIGSIKRNKIDTSGDDDWTADSEEDRVVIGRSDVIQRAFSRAQSNGSNRGPMTGTDLTNSMLASKGVFKHGNAQQSNVYIVHRKDGIIKLDSSPTNKISVKGPNHSMVMVQNRDGTIVRKQIVSNTSHNSITPVKVMTKADGSQVVTQMKVVPKSSPPKAGAAVNKNEPVKIQPKPDPNQVQQIHLVTALPSPVGIQSQRVSTATNVRPTGQRVTADNTRPLLPRPAAVIRTSTPSTAGIVNITQTRTQVKPGTPTIQRQIVQKQRPNSTIVQVNSPGVASNVPTKITVANQQGKIIQKTIGNQALVTSKPLPRTALPSIKSQASATPQQKMLAARRKVAAEAGILPKTNVKGASGGVKGANRAKAGSNASAANKPKESKLAETDGLHMEFHEVESEESSSEGEVTDFPALPAEPAQPAEPDSPPRQFTLCPLTGRIIGPDGQPIEQQEPEIEPVQVPTPLAIVQASASGTTATIGTDGLITTSAQAETAEMVLPNLEDLSEATGGMVRVEMSPGGTTGTIVQTSEASSMMANVIVPGPDLPCLDDPSVEVITSGTSSGMVMSVPQVAGTETTVSSTADQEPAATMVVTTTADGTIVTTTQAVPTSEAGTILNKQEMISGQEVTATNVKMEENAGLVTITGDDGVLYQVTGQAEDGQTLLVTRAGESEQQCVYVTTEPQPTEDGSGVLTLDHAVAEAVAQLMPDQVNLAPQFYVKETTENVTETTEGAPAEGQQMVMTLADGSIVDNSNVVVPATGEDVENQAQVVAQVIQADEPTPGGTRRVVLLLPDGNLMMTEVDEEQYAALELDK